MQSKCPFIFLILGCHQSVALRVADLDVLVLEEPDEVGHVGEERGLRGVEAVPAAGRHLLPLGEEAEQLRQKKSVETLFYEAQTST